MKTKIFGEIDSVNSPILITPWFWRHMSNSMGGFLVIYYMFILLKYIFNRYPIKNNRRQYFILFYFINWAILNQIKPNKALEGNPAFAFIKTIPIIWLLEKYYLSPKESLKNKSSFLDKFFSKEYNGEYKSIQPYSRSSIYVISLYSWLYSHTVYEYYTAGNKGKDSWWNSAMGSQTSIDPDHILSNSYQNSVGDTIGGLIGCLIVITAIKKNRMRIANTITLVSYFYTGAALVEVYRDLGWTID